MIRRPLLLAAALTLLTAPALADSYSTSRLHVQGVIGEVTVTVVPGASRMEVQVTGTPERVARIQVRPEGDRLHIEEERERNRTDEIKEDNTLTVAVTVPAGSPVELDDLIGTVRIGDLDAPLSVQSGMALDLEAGRVTQASLSVSGAGDLTVGAVSGALSVSISGAGAIKTGAVGGPTSVALSGFGSASIASVSGPVSIQVSGAGDVDIAGGHTPSLDVSVSGMGNVRFDGVADRRQVNTSGMGKVEIGG